MSAIRCDDPKAYTDFGFYTFGPDRWRGVFDVGNNHGTVTYSVVLKRLDTGWMATIAGRHRVSADTLPDCIEKTVERLEEVHANRKTESEPEPSSRPAWWSVM